MTLKWCHKEINPKAEEQGVWEHRKEWTWNVSLWRTWTPVLFVLATSPVCGTVDTPWVVVWKKSRPTRWGSTHFLKDLWEESHENNSKKTTYQTPALKFKFGCYIPHPKKRFKENKLVISSGSLKSQMEYYLSRQISYLIHHFILFTRAGQVEDLCCTFH